MDPLMIKVVMWTFVAVFVVCTIAGLLVLLERWVPKNPETGKWLLRSVIFTAVGSMVSLGVNVANTHQPGSGNVQIPVEQPSTPKRPDAAIETPPGPTVAEPQEHQDEVSPEPLTPAGPAASGEHPPEVREWALANLGKRPSIAAATDYPSCVAELRGRPANEVAPSDARVCTREIDRFHHDVVIAFYNLKQPYDIALETQEQALRQGGLTGDERPLHDYVVSEMDRLNAPASVEFDRLSSLEARIQTDRRACNRSRCQSPG